MRSIKKTARVEDVITDHPEAHRFLLDKNLKCTHCGEAVWGTLETFLAGCGIRDIDGFMRRLNRHVAKKNAKSSSKAAPKRRRPRRSGKRRGK